MRNFLINELKLTDVSSRDTGGRDENDDELWKAISSALACDVDRSERVERQGHAFDSVEYHLAIYST